MSMVIQRSRARSPHSTSERGATPELRFARRELEPGAWRRFLALAKRSYGPLLVYAALAIAFVVALTIRISAWLPMVWR